MTLGVRYYIGEIAHGDTGELYAALRENDGVVPAEDIASVTFTIQRPDLKIEGPFEGEVKEDGQGYYQYPATATTEAGPYLAKVTFTLVTQEVRTVMANFVVEEPFLKRPETPTEIVADAVWNMLEDCFDSMQGGPVLREFSLANFDKSKIEQFIPEVLTEMNVQMPTTEVSVGEFVNAEKSLLEQPAQAPILWKGVLCRAIKHLSRSYVEQPTPQGAQITYEDRTRYSQMWEMLYKTEHEEFISWVRLWKRGFLNLGHSALLVSSKAGRLYVGNEWRTRNAGRGFY